MCNFKKQNFNNANNPNLTIHAKVPLEQMFGYVTSLRTITSGRANSTMEFSHYAEVSREQQEAILKNQNN